MVNLGRTEQQGSRIDRGDGHFMVQKPWLTLSYAGTDRSGSKGKTLSLYT